MEEKKRVEKEDILNNFVELQVLELRNTLYERYRGYIAKFGEKPYGKTFRVLYKTVSRDSLNFLKLYYETEDITIKQVQDKDDYYIEEAITFGMSKGERIRKLEEELIKLRSK